MLEIAKANEVIENAAKELAPHKICSYVYDLSNAFNRFYHGTKILAEEDGDKKASYIALITLTKEVLETCIDSSAVAFSDVVSDDAVVVSTEVSPLTFLSPFCINLLLRLSNSDWLSST